MAKHDEQCKLKVVKENLSGTAGLRGVGQANGVDHATVRRWIAREVKAWAESQRGAVLRKAGRPRNPT